MRSTTIAIAACFVLVACGDESTTYDPSDVGVHSMRTAQGMELYPDLPETTPPTNVCLPEDAPQLGRYEMTVCACETYDGVRVCYGIDCAPCFWCDEAPDAVYDSPNGHDAHICYGCAEDFPDGPPVPNCYTRASLGTFTPGSDFYGSFSGE